MGAFWGVSASLISATTTVARCCSKHGAPLLLCPLSASHDHDVPPPGCLAKNDDNFVSCTTDRRVAQNLLDMSEVGVLLVGEMHPSKPGRPKDRLALIGRVCARIESVDFNELFKRCANEGFKVRMQQQAAGICMNACMPRE